MNQLYFTALIPPAPLKDNIQELKLEIRNKFGSKHSLNAPPHITLLSPFRCEKKNRDTLNSLLKNFVQKLEPLEVTFDDFSTFPPKVVFIDVVKSPELTEIQSKLEKVARSNPDIFNYNYDERPYHPHLTLAFKDLDKSTFYDIWNKFKDQEFQKSFEASQLYLLKHNGERWVVANIFKLDAAN
ncbi:2'-5' RNA ligase family protein [Gracilimonas sp.]|uniref:2'-5' RNA ligase family protein n=1 Tax=Gracilimonas sp. TaxID=1974203 RepID=UPI0028717495|nr:2'-5' RNA ligase family protein [Gracilimonas sp.]